MMVAVTPAPEEPRRSNQKTRGSLQQRKDYKLDECAGLPSGSLSESEEGIRSFIGTRPRIVGGPVAPRG